MRFIRNKAPLILALVIGLVVMPIALLGWDFSFIPGDLGDTRFNIYVLEHGYQFLIGKHESYWNAPFMYPVKDVITISDNLLGVVPFYSAFRVSGFDLFTSFQLWIITIFGLNFITAYWLFKFLFKNTYAAAIGAFVFAFSISLQSQMAHPQVFARFFIPLAFVFIFKFSKSFEPRYFFLSILCIVGQFYNGIYLGMLTVIPYFLVVLILSILNHKLVLHHLKKLKWSLLISASIGINAILLFILLWPYYVRSRITTPITYEDIFETIPAFISYLFAKNGSLIWKSLETIGTTIPAWYDHQLFPGIFVYISILAVSVLSIKHKQKIQTEIHLLFFTGLVTLLVFMRFGDFSLYQIIFNIPGFQSLRSLTRIIGVDLLFFGLAASFFVNYLIEKFPKREFLVFSLILGVVVTDNYVNPSFTYRIPKVMAIDRVDLLKSKINHLPAGTIISYEPDVIDNAIYVHLDAMLATQALDLICINGYSATSPWAFFPYWTEPNAENRHYWLNIEGVDPELPIIIK